MPIYFIKKQLPIERQLQFFQKRYNVVVYNTKLNAIYYYFAKGKNYSYKYDIRYPKHEVFK